MRKINIKKLNFILMQFINTMYILLVVCLLFNQCKAHIFMKDPPSRHNKYSQHYTNNNLVNYNLNSPLNVSPDYFKFPCKGFSTGPPTTTFNGNTISISLEGTATHGGGHCQFGISYDNKEFVVLKTVLDTCLLDSMTYSFNLPENAMGGNMIVFWSWINRIGNREYYMECADVNVNNGNTQPTSITGKELLVVNLPGYKTVGEWNQGDSSSKTGKNLILQMKSKTLLVKVSQSSKVSQTTQKSTTQNRSFRLRKQRRRRRRKQRIN
jgi:predicted carbohydrate-binding protein with CBM5 and CBM33 domain